MSADENPEGIARLEAGMPILPVVGTLRSNRELGHMLGVSAPAEPTGKRIVDGLVRLSDKAVREYQACREALLLFLRLGNPDHLHRAQDHFESCVQSLHRAINYLDRLRGLGYRKGDGQPLVARPREMEILREPVRARVRTFRDFLEHLEDDLIQDKVPSNRPAFLHLGWEKATINDAILEYRDVVRWCTDLHNFSMALSVVIATVGPAPGVDVEGDA